MSRHYTIMGVGSPLVDILSHVEDDFLHHLDGDKGGMEMIDEDIMSVLIERLDEHKKVSGGSAANTVVGTSKLGLQSCFLGKLGNDYMGDFYKDHASDAGVCHKKFKHSDLATGRCVSLVTPDSQRTMRTFLGASSMLSKTEVSSDDFHDVIHAHIEGYMLFNRDLAVHVLDAAKTAGCKVSVDLASFEVVKANEDIIEDLLLEYVDIVFANEDEAAAYCGSSDPRDALEALAAVCDIAAVKLGPEGALLKRGNEHITIDALAANAIDSTGAGDLWAAGFLFGHYSGKDLKTSGNYGSVLGAEVVQILGANIPEERWGIIKEKVK